MISNNAIPDNNTSMTTTLSPIHETYPEEAVGTTAEAANVLIGSIIHGYRPEFKNDYNNLTDSYQRLVQTTTDPTTVPKSVT